MAKFDNFHDWVESLPPEKRLKIKKKVAVVKDKLKGKKKIIGEATKREKKDRQLRRRWAKSYLRQKDENPSGPKTAKFNRVADALDALRRGEMSEEQKRTFERGDVVKGRRGNFEGEELVVHKGTSSDSKNIVVKFKDKKVLVSPSDFNQTGRARR